MGCKALESSLFAKWRPEPESNRRARICSPLRNHSAIGPRAVPFQGFSKLVNPAWSRQLDLTGLPRA